MKENKKMNEVKSEEENKVKSGQIYKHFKGNIYSIVDVAIHTETGEKLVVYRDASDDGKIYARPYEMFISKVDRDKYPDVEQENRFALVEEKENKIENDYKKIDDDFER